MALAIMQAPAILPVMPRLKHSTPTLLFGDVDSQSQSVQFSQSVSQSAQIHGASNRTGTPSPSNSQDEEDGAALGVVEESEVGGDVLGHLPEVDFKAAQEAGEGQHVERQDPRGGRGAGGDDDGEDGRHAHEDAQREVGHAHVRHQLRDLPTRRRRGCWLLRGRRRVLLGGRGRCHRRRLLRPRAEPGGFVRLPPRRGRRLGTPRARAGPALFFCFWFVLY